MLRGMARAWSGSRGSLLARRILDDDPHALQYGIELAGIAWRAFGALANPGRIDLDHVTAYDAGVRS